MVELESVEGYLTEAFQKENSKGQMQYYLRLEGENPKKPPFSCFGGLPEAILKMKNEHKKVKVTFSRSGEYRNIQNVTVSGGVGGEKPAGQATLDSGAPSKTTAPENLKEPDTSLGSYLQECDACWKACFERANKTANDLVLEGDGAYEVSIANEYFRAAARPKYYRDQELKRNGK